MVTKFKPQRLRSSKQIHYKRFNNLAHRNDNWKATLDLLNSKQVIQKLVYVKEAFVHNLKQQYNSPGVEKIQR